VVAVEPIRDNLRPRVITGSDAGVQALYTRLQLACSASRRSSYARARLRDRLLDERRLARALPPSGGKATTTSARDCV
jgi:hypothetical protein